MKKRLNLLQRFFFRMSFALVVTSVFWIGMIYYYQISQFPDRIRQNLGITPETLAEEMTGIKCGEEFDRKAKTILGTYPILSLELYNADKTNRCSLFEANGNDTLKTYHEEWHRQADRIGENAAHFFVGQQHYLHFSAMIPDGSQRYIEAIINVPKRQVENITRSTKVILVLTLGTIFIITIALFPLIYFAYRALQRQKDELLLANLQMINALGNAIAKRDTDTSSHNYRVVYYTVKLAEALGIENESIRELIKGAFLHDIGKIGIRDDILLKPEALDSEKFKIMKTHTIIGEEIVSHVNWLDKAVKTIRHHHERYDGKGYPDGLAGEQIPLGAKIFSLADVFDALTSKRPYKEPFGLEESLQIIADESGSRFDPELTAVFITIAPKLYSQIRGKDVRQLRSLLIADIGPYFDLQLNSSRL